MSDTHRLTPEWILELARAMSRDGVIGLDPCTFPNNPTRARAFFTEADDGLSRDWGGHGLTWTNEPYSRRESPIWSAKIVEQALRGVEIVRLTRASTDTQWWHDSVKGIASARCFLEGRPKHATPGAEAKGAGKFPSVFVYYGTRVGRFREVFSPYGDVVQ